MGSGAWVSRPLSPATIRWFFGTLYIFSLIGLFIGLVSDLMYVWIDPRIDFERRMS